MFFFTFSIRRCQIVISLCKCCSRGQYTVQDPLVKCIQAVVTNPCNWTTAPGAGTATLSTVPLLWQRHQQRQYYLEMRQSVLEIQQYSVIINMELLLLHSRL
jgi:hypothetical protein